MPVFLDAAKEFRHSITVKGICTNSELSMHILHVRQTLSCYYTCNCNLELPR